MTDAIVAEGLTKRYGQVEALRGLDLRVVRLPQPSLRDLYESPLVLIRPDQIVAWRGSSAEGAQAVLEQALGHAFVPEDRR